MTQNLKIIITKLPTLSSGQANIFHNHHTCIWILGPKKCNECLAVEEAGKYGASLPKIAEAKKADLGNKSTNYILQIV